MSQQLNLPITPQAVPKPRDLDISVLVRCSNWRDAVRAGIRHSYYIKTQGGLADELGIDRGTFSLILTKKSDKLRYFDADRFREVEQILGNRCISQFFELESKGLLMKDHAMTDAEKVAAYDRFIAEAG